jgi:Leucine-rich repeat (LRR) protein
MQAFTWGVSALSELSPDIGRLQSLEYLTLVNTRIRRLPDAFCTLGKLKATRLHKNRLKELPETIGQLESLEQLSLYMNEISSLPASFASLIKLEKLNLAHNRFEVFPSQLAQLPRLAWLAYFDNPQKLDDAPFPFAGKFLGMRPFNARESLDDEN